MAAHLHAVLRATLGCRLALHPRVGTGTGTNFFTLHTGRPKPPPPPLHHDRASFFVPARGLVARASKKKDAAAAAIAAKGGNDAKKADAAAAKMVTATKKGAAVLDPQIPDHMKESWHVLQIYDATLNQTNVGGNNNKFFIIQALESDGGASWMVYWRYGRVGHQGRSELRGPMTRDQAVDLFEFKFKDKTGNDWSYRKKLSCRPEYYTWLEMDYGKGDDETGKTQKKYSVADQIRETKLETQTARFISVICDISMMKQQMMEIGYNAEKLPLGKISKSTIRKGYSILKRISSALPKADPIQLEELTGEFYTVIPHDFGFKKMREFIIDTPEKLKAKLEMVEALGEIEIATRLLEDNQSDRDDPLYARYKQLHCDFTPLEVDSEEYSMIKTYLTNTHAKRQSGYTVNIEQVFKVTRQDETERFQKFIGAGNRMLLWHGSRLTNWTRIFSRGLRIAPPEAPSTGYMFGKGVYFADMFSKSANYCYPSQASRSGVLLLCEVALGEMNELLDGDINANNLPEGKLSTKGVGKTAPDMAESKITDDGVVVPLAKPKKASRDNGVLYYNEYIVYNLDQIRMRYVLHVSFNYKQ
ncbi:poly [ADP-ribose] polymerase 2-like [Triticum urartu]|uniref:poly [ADP-ribose] polymerase 2-like n=1 Tax=Triticum urartu TaxID=4572 RepID=UPI002043D8EC|nr:poly [ADP-ribose] polymerase 2-like [Triticum urartu]